MACCYSSFFNGSHSIKTSVFSNGCSVQVELASWIRQHGGVHSLEPKVIEGVCGLRNQGATCYMNSLLQGANAPGPIISHPASLHNCPARHLDPHLQQVPPYKPRAENSPRNQPLLSVPRALLEFSPGAPFTHLALARFLTQLNSLPLFYPSSLSVS